MLKRKCAAHFTAILCKHTAQTLQAHCKTIFASSPATSVAPQRGTSCCNVLQCVCSVFAVRGSKLSSTVTFEIFYLLTRHFQGIPIVAFQK